MGSASSTMHSRADAESGQTACEGQASQQQQQALSGDQLAVLYISCLKLASENKIDKNNTWQLGLIDHLVRRSAPDAIRHAVVLPFLPDASRLG